MIHHYWWIPCVILMYVVYAWVTHQNNTQEGIKWFILLSVIGAFPLWSFVSKISKNLVVDGIIYNFILLSSETFALIIFTGMKPTPIQLIGVGLSIVGLILINS